MAWILDTCLLIDIADSDPNFGAAPAQFLDSKRLQTGFPALNIETP